MIEVPKGAVIAFNSSANEPCPGEEWELFDAAKGRFLLGAGFRISGELTPRPPFFDDQEKSRGGKERVKLSMTEIPPHGHEMSIYHRRVSSSSS